MDAFFGLIGFAGFIYGIIRLIRDLKKKAPLKPVAIILVVSLVLFSIGLALPSSSPDDAAPGDKPGVEVEEETGTQPEEEDIPPEDGQDNSGDGTSPSENNEQEDAGDEDESEPAQTAPVGQLVAHFIDVGQGDAILIQTPTKNILIDAGEQGNTVVNYLESKGVTHLDLVIGTHPHSDHIGGLVNVLQSIPVDEVIDPGVVHTTKTFEDYLTLIDQKDITFTEGRAGMSRDLGGGASMKVLHPSSPSSSDLNNASVVVRVTFGKTSFMLTGDAESESESQILSRGYALNSTVLKVGHHGSRTSTSSAFLSAVNPSVAVIMCGTGNSYGHPHEETLAKLANAGVDIYRTDVQGTIVITTDGQTYEVNPKQPYQYNPPKESTKPEPQPEPEPEPEPTVSQGQFVGSIESNKYHYPDCRYAEKILPENQIWFEDVADALAHGYEPCGVCKPPSE